MTDFQTCFELDKPSVNELLDDIIAGWKKAEMYEKWVKVNHQNILLKFQPI
jgi:hypothetical protein